jgi:hypothetical protein
VNRVKGVTRHSAVSLFDVRYNRWRSDVDCTGLERMRRTLLLSRLLNWRVRRLLSEDGLCCL